jgi:hypothetical protein
MSVLLDDHKNNHLPPTCSSYIIDVSNLVSKGRLSKNKIGINLSVAECAPLADVLSPIKTPLIANVNRIVTKNKGLRDIFGQGNPRSQHSTRMKEVTFSASPEPNRGRA